MGKLVIKETSFPCEKKMNLIIHLFGMGTGIVMAIGALLFAHSVSRMLAGFFLGGSILGLYLASGIYRGVLFRRAKQRKRFQTIYDCSIFILGAGTASFFGVCAYQNASVWLGIGFQIYIGLIALLGICLRIKDIEKYKKTNVDLCILLGISLIAQCTELVNILGKRGIVLLLLGVLFYCIGLLLSVMKKTLVYMTGTIFCVVASIMHCVCATYYVI